MITEQGCPAQVEVTELYEPRFRVLLDNIEDLNRKLSKKPTQTFLRWRERFVRDTSLEAPQEFELYGEDRQQIINLKPIKEISPHLSRNTKNSTRLRQIPSGKDQIKEEYKERIDAVKEALADKNAEDIRQWVRENANHPIFMAMAERISAMTQQDAEILINDLNAICDEYHKFRNTEDPDFFG